LKVCLLDHDKSTQADERIRKDLTPTDHPTSGALAFWVEVGDRVHATREELLLAASRIDTR
jgi:hypothetical protein